jgi:hypothetical protein
VATLYSTVLTTDCLKTEHSGLMSASVLIPQGLVFKSYRINVSVSLQQLHSHSRVLNLWPCGSVKWIYSEFILESLLDTGTSNTELTLNVENIERIENIESVENFALSQTSPETAKENTETIQIQASDNSGFALTINGQIIKVKYCLEHTSLQPAIFEQTKHVAKNNYTNEGLVFSNIVNISANLALSNGKNLDFTIELVVYPLSKFINALVSIHNTLPAKHNNGQWDLGDDNSIYFDQLNIVIQFKDDVNYTVNKDLSSQPINLNNKRYEIGQYSSGGENWQSPVHVDASGQIPFSVNGYIEKIDSLETQHQGRVSPSLLAFNSHFTCLVKMAHFWEKFPSQITCEKQTISLGLFPKLSYQHELQGGEKATRRFSLGFSGDNGAQQKTHILAKNSHYLLADPLIINSAPSLFSALIDSAIEGADSFFEKRENVDEFGWRNFGDLYADHETSGYQGSELFVSHYNNQYDPIFGFLRQYLITGNQKWFELADDLAHHVVDIDIYHTTEDKNEYNGGMFWHTDHYLQAFTSSHRSYSKHQTANAYQDHAGGGGPGGQHCYTTGLMLHYLLTANTKSKQAVLTLTGWITYVYEGSNTCLELLLALKNRHTLGYKNQITGQYPLDRGTANYINSLLDSFEINNERSFLLQAEKVLRNTLHPNENLQQRNLQNVELSWFYTVLLQSVCRYLSLKQINKEYDDSFYYCRDCLLNFANWMMDNEYPYLDKPEILEYPNDTWTAQDLRKAHILAAAYYYCPQNNPVFLEKAEFFEHEVAKKLNQSATKTYTRIIVLVLQNCGAVDFYKNRKSNFVPNQYRTDWPDADYANITLLNGFIKELVKRLSKLSFKNEINWLKKRIY